MTSSKGDVMKTFESYLQEKGYARNTIDSYVFASDQLIEKTSTIDNRSLLEHKEWLVASFAPKTANNRIGAINVYLDFIGFEGIRLKGIRVQQKTFLDNVVSNEEYALMREGLKRDKDLYWYFVLRYLACTGARVSELRRFRVTHVTCGYMDIISKGQKLRRIWIPNELANETLAWKDGVQASELLFRGKGANAITARGIASGLKRIARRYGVNPDVVYPHSFRHLFAKNFIKRNPDIAFLADLMGHDNIETTRIYLRRTANEQRTAVDEAIDW